MRLCLDHAVHHPTRRPQKSPALCQLAARAFGHNSGGQIFAVRPDGTGLRQVTNARGFTTDADGTFHAELVGPIAYGPGLGALP